MPINTSGALISQNKNSDEPLTSQALADRLPELSQLIPGSIKPWWDLLASYPLLAALVTILAFFVIAGLTRAVLFYFLSGAARLTHTQADDKILQQLRRPLFTTVFLAGVALAINIAQLPFATGALTGLTISIIVISWMLALLRLSNCILDELSRAQRFKLVETRTVPLINLTAKLVTILLGSYLLLIIWGINPAGWLASAGIVGIAVGFAAKDTLANLFSGFFIVADAPYKIGDYITLDSGERGRITAIGLRSTRLMTRDDVEITIPNGVIAAAKIVNESGGPSSSMRVAVAVGVAYGSDIDQVLQVLQQIGDTHSETLSVPEPRVRMRAFGASSLDFELLCWINKPEDKGRIVHELLVETYKQLARHGIEIPYAKRDLYIKEMPAKL